MKRAYLPTPCTHRTRTAGIRYTSRYSKGLQRGAVPIHNLFDLYSRMSLERDSVYKSQVNKAKQADLFTICTAGMRTAGFLCTDRSAGGRGGDRDPTAMRRGIEVKRKPWYSGKVCVNSQDFDNHSNTYKNAKVSDQPRRARNDSRFVLGPQIPTGPSDGQ